MCLVLAPIGINLFISAANRKAIYDNSSKEGGFMSQESGRLAWLLWRSAYFTMTLSWRNKYVSCLVHVSSFRTLCPLLNSSSSNMLTTSSQDPRPDVLVPQLYVPFCLIPAGACLTKHSVVCRDIREGSDEILSNCLGIARLETR